MTNNDTASNQNEELPLTKEQLADIEALKSFNILPIHFIRRNSGRVTDDYTILSPPIGKGKLIIPILYLNPSGAFGEVRKAYHNASGITRAIKIIAKRHADRDQEDALMNEVSIIRSLV